MLMQPPSSAGPAFTQMAVSSIFGSFGNTFVAVAVFFFSFTTIMAYYYIAEVNVAYLTRSIKTTGAFIFSSNWCLSLRLLMGQSITQVIFGIWVMLVSV